MTYNRNVFLKKTCYVETMTKKLTFDMLSVGDTIRVMRGYIRTSDQRFSRTGSMIVGEVRQVDNHPLYGDYILLDNDLKTFFYDEGHEYEVVEYAHLPKTDGIMWTVPNGSDGYTSHFATVYGNPANDVWSVADQRIMGAKLKEIIGSNTIQPFNFV